MRISRLFRRDKKPTREAFESQTTGSTSEGLAFWPETTKSPREEFEPGRTEWLRRALAFIDTETIESPSESDVTLSAGGKAFESDGRTFRFGDLPKELFLDILDLLTREEISNLRLVSKVLNTAVTAIIFQSVTISPYLPICFAMCKLHGAYLHPRDRPYSCNITPPPNVDDNFMSCFKRNHRRCPSQDAVAVTTAVLSEGLNDEVSPIMKPTLYPLDRKGVPRAAATLDTLNIVAHTLCSVRPARLEPQYAVPDSPYPFYLAQYNRFTRQALPRVFKDMKSLKVVTVDAYADRGNLAAVALMLDAVCCRFKGSSVELYVRLRIRYEDIGKTCLSRLYGITSLNLWLLDPDTSLENATNYGLFTQLHAVVKRSPRLAKEITGDVREFLRKEFAPALAFDGLIGGTITIGSLGPQWHWKDKTRPELINW